MVVRTGGSQPWRLMREDGTYVRRGGRPASFQQERTAEAARDEYVATGRITWGGTNPKGARG